MRPGGQQPETSPKQATLPIVVTLEYGISEEKKRCDPTNFLLLSKNDQQHIQSCTD